MTDTHTSIIHTLHYIYMIYILQICNAESIFKEQNTNMAYIKTCKSGDHLLFSTII